MSRRRHPARLTTAILSLLAAVTVMVCFAAPAPATPVRIMPLGDSITRGFGSVDSGGYRRPLYGWLTNAGWEVDFVGTRSNGSFPDPQHEGHDGSYIRRLMTDWVIPAQTAYDPHITLLMAGTNDCWHGTGENAPANAPANLNALIATIFAVNPDTELYVASIPPIWNGQIGIQLPTVPAYNRAIPGIVSNWRNQGKAIHFVDVYPHITVPWDLYDGVHPNDSGYDNIAAAFYYAMIGKGSIQPHKQFDVPRYEQWQNVLPEPTAVALPVIGLFALARRNRACPRWPREAAPMMSDPATRYSAMG